MTARNPRDQKIACGCAKLRDLVGDEDKRHFEAVTEAVDQIGLAYVTSAMCFASLPLGVNLRDG